MRSFVWHFGQATARPALASSTLNLVVHFGQPNVMGMGNLASLCRNLPEPREPPGNGMYPIASLPAKARKKSAGRLPRGAPVPANDPFEVRGAAPLPPGHLPPTGDTLVSRFLDRRHEGRAPFGTDVRTFRGVTPQHRYLRQAGVGSGRFYSRSGHWRGVGLPGGASPLSLTLAPPATRSLARCPRRANPTGATPGWCDAG